MKKAVMLLVTLSALPLFAFDAQDCRGSMTHLATLYELRSLLLKSYTTQYDVTRFADQRIEQLREPLSSGGYRWVRWVRPSGEGTSKTSTHTVAADRDANGNDVFENAGRQIYAVRVVVPRKRSLLNANNPVYVGTARISYEVDGRRQTRDEPINAWMNPDTSRTFDLGTIAERVQVSLDAATARKNAKEAVVEIHLRQAVAQDDPANPAYSTIRMLERVRQDPEPATVDAEIAAIERSLFPTADGLPLLSIVTDLRRADEWMRSEKPEQQEQGTKLLRETLRRLR